MKTFDEVLADLYVGISRPNTAKLMERLAGANSVSEFENIANSVVGTSGLLEFSRLDLGAPALAEPATVRCRMTRIVAGNPTAIRWMAQRVPDAGSYIPVTILIYEERDEVHICYDRLESILAFQEDRSLSKLAKDLDSKVIGLIKAAIQ
jgi:hypothetical protein